MARWASAEPGVPTASKEKYGSTRRLDELASDEVQFPDKVPDVDSRERFNMRP